MNPGDEVPSPTSGEGDTPPNDTTPAGSRPPPITPPQQATPSTSRADPWAHRRAEPRTFAFIWTLYLFIATLSTYAVTMASGIGGHDVVRAAAQMLLVLVTAGIVVIWPMVRLSQVADPRPIAGPVLDSVVVLVPVQAIVWPQAAWWLAAWPFSVVAAVAAEITSWAVLTSALVSIIHSRRRRGRASPTRWMLLVLASLAALHIPAVRGARSVPSDVRVSWMFSPILSVLELTRNRTWSGQPAAVFSGHWRLISLVAGFGLALWLGAIATALRDTGRRRGPRLH